MKPSHKFRSMTGYGGQTVDLGTTRFALELRAVNSRHLDVKVRMPWPAPRLETLLGQAVRKAVIRGRVDVTVRVDASDNDPAERTADILRRAHVALTDLAQELSLGKPALSDVLAHAALLESRSRDTGLPEQAEEALQQALVTALQDLDQMRRTEGAAMARVLREHLDNVEARVNDLEALAAEQPGLLTTRVQTRVERLLAELGAAPDSLEASRLTAEIALLADKADVTEELARLRSHIHQFRELLSGPAPHGRKLEFLLQEMNREVNTTGSKAQDSRIQSTVVELKSTLEKLREVTLNVE